MDHRKMGFTRLGRRTQEYMGKRTLMTNVDGATCLVVEGLSLEIIDDTDWKKPDAVRKEISRKCLKFFTERGIEPHYADCYGFGVYVDLV